MIVAKPPELPTIFPAHQPSTSKIPLLRIQYPYSSVASPPPAVDALHGILRLQIDIVQILPYIFTPNLCLQRLPLVAFLTNIALATLVA